MSYENLEQFSTDITSSDPRALITKWLASEAPYAFQNTASYGRFRQTIAQDWPQSEVISVVGSGNWRYSLNPRNSFREFNDSSDIDVLVISPEYFEKTWQELRSAHRAFWIRWDMTKRNSVLRTGQNVYCGFISPKYIPDPRSRYKFDFLKKCNSYSTSLVGYREVNLMFFKSTDDAIDYYTRGVRLAKGKF